MFKIIYKLFDDTHGIYAYTVEKEETGVWADITPNMIKSEIEKISNAHLDDNKNIIAENIEKIYTGTDYTNPNTKGGKIISGYNDLFTWCKKNRRFNIIDAYKLATEAGINNLPIEKIPYRSYQKKINLICPTCKHQFEASPVFLTQRKNLCPACSARKGSSRTVVSGANDLETWCRANNRLDLLADYSPENPKPTNQIAYTSHDKVKWVCTQCNTAHSYKMAIKKKCIGRGCPYSAGKKVMPGLNDLASAVPNFINYCWDFTENIKLGLDPTQIFRGSSKYEANFICPYCNYKWRISIYTAIGRHLKDGSTPRCKSCKEKLPFK